MKKYSFYLILIPSLYFCIAYPAAEKTTSDIIDRLHTAIMNDDERTVAALLERAPHKLQLADGTALVYVINNSDDGYNIFEDLLDHHANPDTYKVVEAAILCEDTYYLGRIAPDISEDTLGRVYESLHTKQAYFEELSHQYCTKLNHLISLRPHDVLDPALEEKQQIAKNSAIKKISRLLQKYQRETEQHKKSVFLDTLAFIMQPDEELGIEYTLSADELLKTWNDKHQASHNLKHFQKLEERTKAIIANTAFHDKMRNLLYPLIPTYRR